jgi:hypothetical protein
LATEGVYHGDSLRFAHKDSERGFTKELRVGQICERSGVVTWMEGGRVYGTSSQNTPMSARFGRADLTVTTRLVKNQHGIKVQCSISGVVPTDMYGAFSVKPVAASTSKQKKRR